MAIKALIFDMDGVLIDSEPLHLQSFQELLASFGVAYTSEENARYLGRKDAEIALELIDKYSLPLNSHDLVLAKEKIFHQLVYNNSCARPGVLSTLEQARGLNLRIALASSATLASIEVIVGCLQLKDYFDSLTSGDEVSHGKPAPDIFLLASQRLDIEPERCLVIEDTDAGVAAAKSAGMKCIAIPCDATRHQEHRLADGKLESLSELNLADWVRS